MRPIEPPRAPGLRKPGEAAVPSQELATPQGASEPAASPHLSRGSLLGPFGSSEKARERELSRAFYARQPPGSHTRVTVPDSYFMPSPIARERGQGMVGPQGILNRRRKESLAGWGRKRDDSVQAHRCAMLRQFRTSWIKRARQRLTFKKEKRGHH